MAASRSWESEAKMRDMDLGWMSRIFWVGGPGKDMYYLVLGVAEAD